MTREPRPLSRYIINNWIRFLLILIECVIFLASVELIRRLYAFGIFLFLFDGIILFWSATSFWRERNLWSEYEGRQIKITSRGRDEIDVSVDGRTTRIWSEIAMSAAGERGRSIDFSRMIMREGKPMTWDERVELLNIVLEWYEVRGTSVIFDNENLPDTPHVRSALKRRGKEFPERGLT